jgi:5-methylcytosine-specific restriction endonuclease McrA
MIKRCSACGEEKDISEFRKAQRGIFGVRGQCRICQNIKSAEYAKKNPDKVRVACKKWRDENKEYVKQERAKWTLEHPGRMRELDKAYKAAHRDAINKQQRDWRINNPEEAKAKDRKDVVLYHDNRIAYAREYRLKNPEKMKLLNKEWRSNHPEEMQVYESRRRAKKLGNGGTHTANDWRMIKAMYGNKCVACGREGGVLTQDHIKPIALGGSDGIENIQPLCKSCNSSKRITEIDYRPAYYWADWT